MKYLQCRRRTNANRRISARCRNLGIGVLAWLMIGSCCSVPEDQSWLFAVSRSIYRHEGNSEQEPGHEAYESGKTVFADNLGQALLVIAAPLVIDLVFLPIELAHDCLVSVL